jgi:hypothetical protein
VLCELPLFVLPESTGGRVGVVVVEVVCGCVVRRAGGCCCCDALVALPTRRGRDCANAETAVESRRERSRETAAILLMSG